MVGGATGAELEAGHLPLPVLRRPASLDDRARARAARGRHAPPPARAHELRARREARRAAALARPVAGDAAAQARSLQPPLRAESNPLTTRGADARPRPSTVKPAPPR